MDNSDVSLALAPCHISLPTTTSHSFLSPSSALLPNPSEASHQYPPDSKEQSQHEKPQRKAFKSSLMDSLRYRFPDGNPPQALYDEFIQVSLNDVPPDSALVTADASEGHTGNENGPHHFSPIQRLQRMTSRVFSTIAASIASRPPLPLPQEPRPVISNPRPIEAMTRVGTPRERKPRTPSPSPVQFYTASFNGLGPPAPLPLVDIRPRSRPHSRNTISRSRSPSRSHSACSQPKNPPQVEQPVPDLPHPEPAQLATKNSIVFPRASEVENYKERRRAVRIITPRTHGASYLPTVPDPPSAPTHQAQAYTFASYLSVAFFLGLLQKTRVRLVRIFTFVDPAESLFHLGFITGPQTWLLGGWYLTSTSTLTSADRKEVGEKSQLRVWVDKRVHIEKAGYTGGRSAHGDELLERIERMERAEPGRRQGGEQGQNQHNASSSGLTSSSFEVGRRTATTSNASRLLGDAPTTREPNAILTESANPHVEIKSAHSGSAHADGDAESMVVLPHIRSSRAVWSGSRAGIRGYAGYTYGHGYGENGALHRAADEISVDLAQSRWVHRCRIAALISGLVVMSLFVSALTAVCAR
ncbi:hypothetical protein M408DRAFT_16526 [Serendipita vermifera MAFF 305830]|uniref:Uncharacterized protein n=1 Tax=Serendipita vermifera MAFF 305830 TaxID=933852 RepID=A0A0C3B6Y8_SERVB|nr:hypothetical protein M408DRAFT_16526 [Serendipita vermifera MAFF 305830]